MYEKWFDVFVNLLISVCVIVLLIAVVVLVIVFFDSGYASEDSFFDYSPNHSLFCWQNNSTVLVICFNTFGEVQCFDLRGFEVPRVNFNSDCDGGSFVSSLAYKKPSEV